MKRVRLRAYAKVNYSLDVLGLREDGYHEIRTVLQSISLFDEVEVEKAGSGFDLVVEPEDVCPVEENTVYKAWTLFCERAGRELSVNIRLEKRIPSGAGLGGGSADAAAALVGMNSLFDLGLGDEELHEIASKIGADAPFCLMGGTMLGEGVGTNLKPLPAPPHHYVALAKPAASADTAKTYRAYDEVPRASSGDTDAVVAALHSGDPRSLGASLGNDLAIVTGEFVPEVESHASGFIESGAFGASMSGTGTAVYGVFDSMESAQAAASRLDAPFSGVFEPVARGVEVVDFA